MRRILLLVALVLLLLVLGAVLPERGARPEPARPLDAPLAALAGDAASSTWFCAAADAGTPEPPTHTVSLTNPGDRALTATVASHRQAADEAASIEVEVPAHTVVPIGADQFGGTQPGSVTVTANGRLLVTHRLVGEGTSDEAVCAGRASTEWHFPSAYTFNEGVVTSGSARLWVYNPFTADASIDVSIVTEAGVRRPGPLTGYVVGAGTARVIELSEHAQRRDQFAVSIETRSGRVVAELAQATDGGTAPRGLRMQTGIPEPAMRWLFADSEGGAGIGERLVVQNPSADPLTVQVMVRPDGADPEAYPDPFVLDLPGRRYAVIDLTAEARLPANGARTITVETDSPAGVVAARIVNVSGSGAWPIATGAANSTGSRVEATRWWIPRVDQAAEGRSILRLVNTSRESIAVVEITAAGGGALAAGEPTRVEVAAGTAVTVDAGALAPADVPTVLTLESSTPIVVERRSFSSTLTDLWVGPGVADRSTAAAVGTLPDLIEPS